MVWEVWNWWDNLTEDERVVVIEKAYTDKKNN